ncbi:MAG: winged helix DNA-binding domain-containing protein [Aeromicrobium sp.]
MQRFDDDERRRRLGVRHRLAAGTRDGDVVAAAASVVAFHGTDPGSTFLAAWARTEDVGVAEVEHALYNDRSLVRVMAMRRTVFVAPTGDVPVLVAGAGDDVARDERRKLVKLLADSGISDPVAWLVDVERVAHRVVAELGEITPADLIAADERLATTVVLAAGTRQETTVRIASRLLTVLAAEGSIVRGRPKGSWTSMQFRWSALDLWAPDAAVAMDPGEAETALARLWLARFGPATEADLTWWTKWTKTRTRRALAAAGAVEVDLGGVPGLALPDDLEPTPPVRPWGALLPALDPTTMGWKGRDWYLGDHGTALFDINGNAGPTVWWDGRIVGGWAHRPDGEIGITLLADIGADAQAELETQAESLSSWIGDVRLTARARGYSPVERELLGRTTGRL